MDKLQQSGVTEGLLQVRFLGLGNILCFCRVRGLLRNGYSVSVSEYIPCLNPLAAISNLGKVVHSYCRSSLSCLNKYLAIDNGGHLHMNCLCAIIAARMNAISTDVEMVFN